MTDNDSPLARGTLIGLPIIMLGLAGVLLGGALDGFVGGFVEAASVALLVVGAFVVGATLWPRRDADDQPRMWLPSRDDQ